MSHQIIVSSQNYSDALKSHLPCCRANCIRRYTYMRIEMGSIVSCETGIVRIFGGKIDAISPCERGERRERRVHGKSVTYDLGSGGR